MHEVVSLAVKVARSDAAILVSGPNGAGKERLAQIVQANSRRRDKPFVQVNAGGLPDELSRPSSSAPKPARTPEPRSYASVASKKRTAERSSSTRSATSRPTGR